MMFEAVVDRPLRGRVRHRNCRTSMTLQEFSTFSCPCELAGVIRARIGARMSVLSKL